MAMTVDTITPFEEITFVFVLFVNTLPGIVLCALSKSFRVFSSKKYKKITIYFNFTKTNPYYHFNPVKKKRQFFRVGNTLTFAASPLFHPLSISSPSPFDTHKKQPLLSFLSLLSKKKIFRVGNRVCIICSGVIVTFGCL
jgi:hypothetical protein